MKILKESLPEYVKEAYGAGYSVSSFKGNLGGGVGSGASALSNMNYSYEIKALNHTLEQRPTDTLDQVETIKIGSKISGYPVQSNATPVKNKIRGLVRDIVKAADGSIKYYFVLDEATQTLVKVDATTAHLITHEPVEYYHKDNIVSRRKQKIKNTIKESFKLTGPSWEETLEAMEGMTPDEILVQGAKHGSIEVVQYALDKGANVHANEDLALRRASLNGYDDVVKLLLDAGANVHAYGDRSLLWAAEQGHEEVVKLLLNAGADNKWAIQKARNFGYSEIADMIQDQLDKESMNEDFTSEGVGDKYAEKRFNIPDEDKEFEKKFKSNKLHKNEIVAYFDNKKEYFIVKNPDSLKNFGPNVRGLISKRGDLYLENQAVTIHDAIAIKLRDAKEITYNDFWWLEVPKDFLTLQRVSDTNMLAIGESNEPISNEVSTGRREKFKMSPVEEVYPIYEKFINLAQDKHPNIEFKMELVDQYISKMNRRLY